MGCPMGQGEHHRPQSIGEFLLNELRQAFQDVRQKVLEEGWFGRVVTAAPVVEMDRSESPPTQTGSLSDRRPSFEELWEPRERDGRDTQRGLDIDR